MNPYFSAMFMVDTVFLFSLLYNRKLIFLIDWIFFSFFFKHISENFTYSNPATLLLEILRRYKSCHSVTSSKINRNCLVNLKDWTTYGVMLRVSLPQGPKNNANNNLSHTLDRQIHNGQIHGYPEATKKNTNTTKLYKKSCWEVLRCFKVSHTSICMLRLITANSIF